ncbi:MAG: hypothetical protein HY690_12410, partial [Chloroflexi bacterium]|nr:hypothetical protein [Chloroflexota bacterium]
MPFTSDDFQDLIRLLERHPEWRPELRRLVLSEELLELPARIGQLADSTVQRFGRLDAALERLAEAQEQTERRLATLTARVDALAEAQARTEQQLATLTARVDALAEAQARTEQQ